MKNYFEAFTIPYWQSKVTNWEQKKKCLLTIYNNTKINMNGDDQYTDYNNKNNYPTNSGF